ncbi:MAG: sodium:proton antiporter [Acidobacteriota bacterium]
MEHTIEIAEFLMLVAAIVGVLAQRVHIPYSVGLVLAGIVLAFIPYSADLPLNPDLIFVTLLPPLVFEAAFQLPWHSLRRDLPLILLLASVGVVLAAGVTTVGMHFIAGWPWLAALVFGMLIAATDPVSVIAAFKECGIKGRLRLLMEAESLFNDGTAAVGFGIAVALAMGQHSSVLELARTLVVVVGGGIASGALVAGAILLLAGRTADHLFELTFTTVAAYGSFLLAEHFHLSGILATVTAAIMLGNLGHLGAITARGREAVEAFWEFAAFVANSLIFLLLGLQLEHQHFSNIWLTAAAAVVIVILGRAVAVYPISWLFSRSSLRVSFEHQNLLFWGGLRGALALALALGLPLEMPLRYEIITVSFAVVASSIFLQGLTIPPLLRRVAARERESTS